MIRTLIYTAASLVAAGSAQAGNPQDPTDFYHAVAFLEARIAQTGDSPLYAFRVTPDQEREFMVAVNDVQLFLETRGKGKLAYLCTFDGEREELTRWFELRDAETKAYYAQFKKDFEAELAPPVIAAVQMEVTDLPFTRERASSPLARAIRDGSWKIEDSRRGVTARTWSDEADYEIRSCDADG